MKTKIFALLLLVLVFSCKKTNNQQEIDNQQTSNETVSQQTPQKSELIALKGTIDNKIPVSFVLFIVNDNVSGFYVYDKVGLPINLMGTKDNNKIILGEYDNNLIKVASLEINFDDANAKLSGNWSNEKKNLPISLEKMNIQNNEVSIPTNFGTISSMYILKDTSILGVNCDIYRVKLIITPKKIKDYCFTFFSENILPKQTPNLEISYKSLAKPFENIFYYSYFIQQSLMEEWKNIIDEGNTEETGILNYEITQRTQPINFFNDIVVLENTFYDYTGGAHGMYGANYNFIDLKEGKLIKYFDILDTNKKTIILDAIKQKIKNSSELTEMVFDTEEVTFTDNIKISKDSLVFNYMPYEIGSFAAGIIEVPFKYTEIKSFLKPEFIKRMKL